jgi:hypothetical protein
VRLPPFVSGAACLATAAFLVAAATARSASVEPRGTATLRYDRDVRPILADRCFTCHGPDMGKREAKLRLDTFEGATAERRAGAAIVPGDPDASLVLERVTSHDDEERMPPGKGGKHPLSDEQVAVLRRWIAEGAVYEPHWSFVPPVRPSVPAVRDARWSRNPVDRFVLAKLESEGFAPSPEADRATLLRRVFLDLTGLPPTPEELDAFLADARPDAYERWVQTLLTEEPYLTRHAERMAQPWLDAARYADTCGIHMDAGRQTWLWRDWVLDAFRSGMPYDRFLTEQLAGDLLSDATDAQKTATGFLRNHVTTDEGGAIAEEYLVEYAVDRTATTGSVFLGLTLGCARCHDHKYDPITQQDFYSFLSFFNSIEEPGLYSQLPDPERAFEPYLVLPRPEQKRERDALGAELALVQRELERTTPEEERSRTQYLESAAAEGALRWETPEVVSATSTGGATLTVQPDGSVLASGANPERDDHELVLRVRGEGNRLLLLEALTDPSLPMGRVGRAENGNAVLSGVTIEAVRTDDPTRRERVPLAWAWADHEQADGDFRVVNALDEDADGWAVDAHRRDGPRVALFLADRPFGFSGGSELRVRLEYRSVYARHAFGRVRLRVARLAEPALERLPLAQGTWRVVGPFPADSRESVFAQAFGPETDSALDPGRNFGFGNQFWRADPALADGRPNALPGGVVATYVGRRLYSPSARAVTASLGSDDGFRLSLNGAEVASRQVDRGVMADQDRAELALPRGTSTVVLKDVNTGGEGGFYWQALPREGELDGDLVAGLLPADARTPDLDARVARAWKLRSPEARRARERVASLQAAIAALEARYPKTMVMQELAQPRPTFVLQRGQYDKPDKERPVTRAVPAALGRLPDGAPPDRRGLAQWMVAPENPLVARVAANRLWELVFGAGLVRTSEDLGLQGEWPSHPELLDWLAVELRESGWDLRHVLRLLVTSSAYRQSSVARPEVRERDPDDRWLAWFPRKRLAAEAIRDQALYAAGLLVEDLGGRSVKPYQPDGLWQEVAMVQSNTRVYQRGEGADLWRRSLYTYWKRACPPPALLTFDAPTRESCVVRRPVTNTPLQALVLWNDEQFVEAARALAARTLREERDDGRRVGRIFRRCTGREPDAQERDALLRALGDLRARFQGAEQDARALVEVGASPLPALPLPELAAWTLVASAVLNLDATLVRG